MVSHHPSYPNPTIREVVCEIHFKLSDVVSWDPSWYSQFFKQVEAEFPTFEPVIVPVLFEITQASGSGGVTHSIPQVIRYRHRTRNVLLQLSENRITINILPVYPGWQQVSKDIEYAWRKLNEVMQPATVIRLGLRYINVIERRSAGETADHWIVPNHYLPAILLSSYPGFASQVVTRFDAENRIQVTFTDQFANGSGAFIFDIDRIVERNIDTKIEQLLQEITLLHDNIWAVFQSAKSDNLERLLQGEL
ncbi:MAG: TIGR04255 family protein [Caldilinea sp. CFX5]|nr:TIGR04255 family protein [Caldilinea sp. CFX5]